MPKNFLDLPRVFCFVSGLMEVMGIFSTNLGLMEDDGWNWLALLSLKRRPHVFFDYYVNLTILDEGLWEQRLPKVSKNLGQLLHASNIHQYLET